MLQQTIRGSRTLQNLTLQTARPGVALRCISKQAKSKTPESASQKELNANQKRLEELEKKGDSKNSKYQMPSREELKKKGEDAQVEQQRPDDGVY
ncbi:LAME_0C05996g1_1 [Lachancea meyersii CBS 8951]|uniref:LAME_0C05996g1_1 n=1 Tax=Lachancea meyersii CBS 8951 TaxID=1266667 RepID=A0A1G4J2P9_9SACH|nr:LAME_0C05996g1_1 [Lachancea meyersii CBS 8951]